MWEENARKQRGKLIMQEILGSVFLAICSVTDIVSKKIYLNVCTGFMAAGILINLMCGRHDISYFIKAVIPGIIVMIISLATRESVGAGDGLIIITTGVIYGLSNNLNICGMAFFVLLVYCVIMLLAGRMKLSDKIPFSPFLMIGNMVFILYGRLV